MRLLPWRIKVSMFALWLGMCLCTGAQTRKIKCFPTQWKISSIGDKCMKSILLSCLKEKSTETTCILTLLPNPCYEVNPIYLPQPPTWLLRSLLLTKGRDLQRWPRHLCSLPPGHTDLASVHSAEFQGAGLEHLGLFPLCISLEASPPTNKH